MNPDWQTLAGAEAKDFGNPAQEILAARDETVAAPLNHLGLIRVSGADAVAFLQNLTSNDVKKLPENKAEYNSVNSAKGRMIANFLTWRDEGDLLLALPRDLAAGVRKKLAMYVLRSKVTLSDATAERALVGLSGKDAAAALAALGAQAPDTALGLTRFAGGSVMRLGGERFLLALTASATPEIWRALCVSVTPVGTDAWRWLDIRDAIPWLSLATQEQFVPQQINFDALGGISFTKGCYPGQEVVARTHYLGKIKRRMFPAHAATYPAPGTPLFSATTGEQACGNVVNSVASPEGGFDLLAVIQLPSLEAGAVHVGTQDGAALEIRPLPYGLPE